MILLGYSETFELVFGFPMQRHTGKSKVLHCMAAFGFSSATAFETGHYLALGGVGSLEGRPLLQHDI